MFRSLLGQYASSMDRVVGMPLLEVELVPKKELLVLLLLVLVVLFVVEA